MLNSLAKGILVTTSFAPVLLSFGFVEWQQNGFSNLALGLVAATAVLVVLCIVILKIAASQLERLRFPIASVKAADTESVGYVVAYLLPLVNTGEPNVNVGVLIFVLGVFILAVWGSNTYHFNPLLGILGFHFYEVTTESGVTFLLISRTDVRRSADVKAAVQLTEYLVLASEE